MNKKNEKSFEYSDEYCGKSGCGIESEESSENQMEDMDFHNIEKESIMHLTLEDNTELDAIVLGFFEVDEKEYVALLPEEEEDVLVYEYIELEDEAFDLKHIDDDKEFQSVSETFHELFSDEEIEEYEVHHQEDEKFVKHDDYDSLKD